MSNIKQRTVNFLYGERSRLLTELEEVDLLLSLLDEEPATVQVPVPVVVEQLEKEHPPESPEVPVEAPELEPVGVVVDVPPPPPPPPRNRDQTGLTKEQIRQRAVNDRRRIVAFLADGKPRTIAEVARAINLNESGTGDKLRELLEQGRVTRARQPMKGRRPKPGSKGVGKAPWLYQLTPMVEQREHHLDEKSRLVLD